jgi:hypothetical protein
MGDSGRSLYLPKDFLMASQLAGALVSLTRPVLTDAIAARKAERTPDQKDNGEIEHAPDFLCRDLKRAAVAVFRSLRLSRADVRRCL